MIKFIMFIYGHIQWKLFGYEWHHVFENYVPNFPSSCQEANELLVINVWNYVCVFQVLELEGKDKGEWGFKALKQMIKINFRLVRQEQVRIKLYNSVIR